jgi:hypothetical protein
MLAPGLEIPLDGLLDRIKRRRREPTFRPILLKEDVTVSDMRLSKRTV